MNYWIENYLVAFLLSVVLAGMIIPKILLIAFRKKLFDSNDERKIHKGVVPRLGGISFLPAFGFSFCLVVGINLRVENIMMHIALVDAMLPVIFLMCALLLTYLVGMCDDLIGVRYRAKFIFQILAGILIVSSGLWIHNLDGFFWIEDVPSWLGWLITIFLIIYVMNALNLIDGIDGLASGLSMVALIWYSYVFYEAGQYINMMLAGATLGTLVPFFYYNVFGNAESQTKIFMGDTGSLTIGLMIVFFTIEVFNIAPVEVAWHNNLFVLAIAPIILPCFDVVRVFMHRVRKGRNPFLPDKSHIHHKLLAIGFKQSKALITILFVDAAFIVINLLLSSIIQPTLILLGDVVVWTALNIGLTKVIRMREQRKGIILYE